MFVQCGGKADMVCVIYKESRGRDCLATSLHCKWWQRKINGYGKKRGKKNKADHCEVIEGKGK